MVVTEAFFQQFTQPRTVTRYHEVEGSCRWEVEGVGSWLLELNQGVLTVSRDPKKSADCTITCNQRDFDRLVHRQLNPFTAFLQGLVNVTGNLSLAQLGLRLFRLPLDSVPPSDQGNGGRRE